MLLVFGFGCVCGLLLYIAIDLERTLANRRAMKRLQRTITQQEQTIITQQNALVAEREENRRQRILLNLMDNAPRIDTAPHPAHLLPFGRPVPRPTRMN